MHVLTMMGPASLFLVLGLLLSLAGRQALTEWIIHRIGREWFAPIDTLEGCSTALVTGVVSGLVALFTQIRLGPGPAPLYHNVPVMLLTPIVVLLGTVAYGLIWLFNAAEGMRGRQFRVEGDSIRRCRDALPLKPDWAEAKSRLVQSSPVCGCILYALILYGDTGEIARNGYSSQEEFLEAKEQVLDAIDGFFVEWRRLGEREGGA